MKKFTTEQERDAFLEGVRYMALTVGGRVDGLGIDDEARDTVTAIIKECLNMAHDGVTT